MSVPDGFSNEFHRLWFVALTEGGMREGKHFPTEIEGTDSTPCYVCSRNETEIVVHEYNDGRPRNRFVHLECFEDYVEEYVDANYVSVYEVVTVSQHPEIDVEVEIPEEVHSVYMDKRLSDIEKLADE